jgi:hypothetical protein
MNSSITTKKRCVNNTIRVRHPIYVEIYGDSYYVSLYRTSIGSLIVCFTSHHRSPMSPPIRPETPRKPKSEWTGLCSLDLSTSMRRCGVPIYTIVGGSKIGVAVWDSFGTRWRRSRVFRSVHCSVRSIHLTSTLSHSALAPTIPTPTLSPLE